ncbi:hypothetical protein R6Q57_004718 [Mikania cordata]
MTKLTGVCCLFFCYSFGPMGFYAERNAEIEKRNRARELRAQALELPDIDLKRKMPTLFKGYHLSI